MCASEYPERLGTVSTGRLHAPPPLPSAPLSSLIGSAGVAAPKKAAGTLALLGGGEWQEPTRDLDRALLALSGTDQVLVLPAAAAFEHPDRVVDRARAWFEPLGAKVTGLSVVNRRDAESHDGAAKAKDARFIYVADGSPLHLRSVLKGSALYDGIVRAYNNGAVRAASGAGATLLCDPMVDPRGGAYTVGLGLVRGLAVFPYHGRAANHLRERRSEEHTSELQSLRHLVCRLLLEKKK